MIKVKYQVFQLDTCVSGFGNDGIHYSENGFTLWAIPEGTFDMIADAHHYIQERLSDYEKRNIKNERLIFQQVFIIEGDDIFDNQSGA